MSQYFKLKTKLFLPLSILILIVLILTTSLISHQYSKGKSLLALENGINLATNISKFVHSTQKERGMTSGFLASNGMKFKNELIKQRSVTDERVQKLNKFLFIIQNKSLLKSLKKGLLAVNELHKLRKQIDKLSLTAQDSIKIYSKINDDILNIIVEISKISKLPKITQNIIAYSNFLYAKENAGLERAVGTAILTRKIYSKSLEVDFINLIAIQKLYIKNFFKYTSENAKECYKQELQGRVISEVENIRDIILYNTTHQYKVKPEFWFKIVTEKINKLQIVDNYLEKEILFNIKEELKFTYGLFGGFAFLNIMSISLFIFMMVLIINLLKSETRLKKLIDKYIISSTTDLQGRITDVSDAFCKISGYKREELMGKPHNVIRHPDMPKSAFKNMWETIQSGKVWSGEVKNLTRDGGYYWVYANIEPLFDKKGRIEGYAAVRLDITDSIRLEEELQRSQQKDKTILQQSKLAQMGEMISMIAHQWRQPLTAISSTSSDLYMKIMLDKYDKEYFNKKLEKIDDLSQHLSTTIDDFRNFYKQDRKKEMVLYCDVAKMAFDIVQTSLDYKNIELKSDFNCQKKIYVLSSELRQVILNLIKNAEDILIEKKVVDAYIEVKTYNDENYSYMDIIDNGGGIPLDIIDKIFDPYFSTKMKKDGTGLGLYMSNIIIKEHCNGELLVTNTEQGAIFTIKIPVARGDENV